MPSTSFRSPPNQNPEVSRALERVIRRLDKDATLRKATPQQVANRRIDLVRQFADVEVAENQLERILAGNDLTDINYLSVGLQKARSVGRVVLRRRQRIVGYGTGFLVAPRVLMTNQHVLSSANLVRDSVVQFRFERDVHGVDLEPVEFALAVDTSPIIDRGMDVAVVRVEPLSADGVTLDSFGWLRLNPSPGKAFIGEYLSIVQHPGGERKQICVRENKLIKYDDRSPVLWYQTDTVGGSSGSPVFNNNWDVVALHHKSVPRMKKVGNVDVWLAKDGKVWQPEMGDDAVDWIANEGVRISRIVEFLRRRHAAHPLSREVCGAVESPLQESFDLSGVSEPGGVRVVKDRQGNTRVFVPVEIDVKMAVGGPQITVPPTDRPPAPSAGTDDAVVSTGAEEKVEIDQTNYHKRNGYNPKFLGDGLVAPLPKVVSSSFGKPLKLKGGKVELKYWNYSVIMNADRGLAFFSAANVFPKNPETSQDGNNFERDPRVDEVDRTAQIGREFYKKQAEFEADERPDNPFDQGHLSRREDLQWGNTPEVAKRNGDDSFHYTNCAPQHFEFNQNRRTSGIWYRLEKAAVDSLSIGDSLCIVNGPVFDAPLCKPGRDGVLRLNMDGRRKPDPKFGGFKIPKQYFKLVAYNDHGALRAKAFVVTQEDLLETIDRLEDSEAVGLTDAEIRLYQVKISDLEKLVGLDFGLPASSQAPLAAEEAMIDDGLPIDSVENLFIG